MPATRSQYWLTGILAALSVGSLVHTFGGSDITNIFIQERVIESQNSIDALTEDMGRLMRSISNWKDFCNDPYAYLRSASVHGSFSISVKDQMEQQELLTLSQIERDALARCQYAKVHPEGARFRLCLSVNEAGGPSTGPAWFDQNHLFEWNVQFRKAGSRLITDCEALSGPHVEVQTYFSAYAADDEILGIKRVSGGVRLPLENGVGLGLKATF